MTSDAWDAAILIAAILFSAILFCFILWMASRSAPDADAEDLNYIGRVVAVLERNDRLTALVAAGQRDREIAEAAREYFDLRGKDDGSTKSFYAIERAGARLSAALAQQDDK